MVFKKALPTIVNLLQAPFRAIDPFERRRRLPSEKKRIFPIRVADHFVGFFYRIGIIAGELTRYRINSIMQESKAWWVYRPLLMYTLKAVLLSSVVFYLLYRLNTLFVNDIGRDALKTLGLDVQDLQSMGDFLGYIVGALTALLAIVFAATSTGFQISASRYSSDVSQFVVENDEFRQLMRIFLVSDIFALTTLVGFNLLSANAYLAVLLTYLLAVLMVVYVVRFSAHLFTLYKPRRIFDGLSRTIDKQIAVASATDFRARSWSLSTVSRKNAKKHVDLIEELYTTLFRSGDYNDSYHIAAPLSYLLKKFSGKAHLIHDSDRPWWGDETEEIVTYDNATMADIKSNFEIKSEGRLTMQSRDFNWFENKLLSLYRQAAKDAVENGADIQFGTICYIYGNAFYGDFRQDKGAWQYANLSIAQGLIDGFLGIDISKLSSRNMSAWLNTFFSLSISIVRNEEREDFDKAITDSYHFAAMNRPFDHILRTQTGIYYEALSLYAKRIAVEIAVEGKVITPFEEYRDEIKDDVHKQVDKFVSTNFIQFVDMSDKVARRAYELEDNDLLASILWIQYRWMNNSFYHDKFERAQIVNIAAHENLKYLIHLPKESMKSVEMIEEIEKAFFTSVLEKQKDCYETSLMAVMLLRTLKHPEQNDETGVIRSAKRLYAHAEFVFYASEYYRDNYYINKFMELNNTNLKVSIYKYLLIAGSFDTQDKYWETQTFHRWFQALEHKMKENLNEIRDPSDGGWGYSSIYDHPSPYIQKLGRNEHGGAIELYGDSDFNDWLEARNALSELLKEIANWGGNA